MTKELAILESNLSGSGFTGIKLCKEAGYRVTFITRDVERYRRIPMGRAHIDAYVDEIVHCETNYVDSVWETMRAKFEAGTFRAFLTLSEYDIVVTSEIATRLGLPSLDPDAARKARNKHLTRVAAAAAGVPIPRFVALKSRDEIADALAYVGLPCIVKPADETSSTDVVKCISREQVEAHFELIKSKIANVRGQDRYPAILIEQCIKGHEVSVETLTIDGRHHVYGVTDKMLAGKRHFVEVGHSFPSSLPEDLVRECERIACASLDAVGFNMGAAHVELKIDETGPKLIEINGRPGGDRIPDLVKLVTGRDPVEDHVDLFIGRSVSPPQVEKGGGAAISFVTAPEGKIVDVAGIDEIAYCSAIREVVLEDLADRIVEPLTKSSTRLGYVIATGGNGYEAWKRAETARQMLNITIEPGFDRP